MVFLSRLCSAGRQAAVSAVTRKPTLIEKYAKVVGPFQTAAQMPKVKSNPTEKIPAAMPIHPCSAFFDRSLSIFLNNCMRKGQKPLMRELMRQTFVIIKQTQLAKYHACKDDKERAEIQCDPLEIFLGALDNCKPLMVTRPVKRGGATYQVPFPLSEYDALGFGMRWLYQSIKDRPKPRKTHFPENMARELIECYYNEGKVVRRKQDMHKQCEANKAYAHYRWN